METSILTAKGQIVVPAALRRKFGLKKGSRVAFTADDSGFIVRPLDRHYFDQFAGILPEKGKALRTLLKERKRDRKREDLRAR
jgi:AbrB family looped-hinge helix DNA binding protein